MSEVRPQSYGTLPSEPGMPERVIRWEGRTGAGQLIRLVESGEWLEFVYYEAGDQVVRGGFALNPLYGPQLVVALVEAIARRATR